MTHTLITAWLAVLIVIGGAVAIVLAGAGILAGGAWVLDRIAKRLGERAIDIGGSIFTLVVILVVLGAAWLGAFYWLMGWS